MRRSSSAIRADRAPVRGPIDALVHTAFRPPAHSGGAKGCSAAARGVVTKMSLYGLRECRMGPIELTLKLLDGFSVILTPRHRRELVLEIGPSSLQRESLCKVVLGESTKPPVDVEQLCE